MARRKAPKSKATRAHARPVAKLEPEVVEYLQGALEPLLDALRWDGRRLVSTGDAALVRLALEELRERLVREERAVAAVAGTSDSHVRERRWAHETGLPRANAAPDPVRMYGYYVVLLGDPHEAELRARFDVVPEGDALRVVRRSPKDARRALAARRLECLERVAEKFPTACGPRSLPETRRALRRGRREAVPRGFPHVEIPGLEALDRP